MVMVIKGWFCKSLSFLLEVRIRVEMGTQVLLHLVCNGMVFMLTCLESLLDRQMTKVRVS